LGPILLSAANSWLRKEEHQALKQLLLVAPYRQVFQSFRNFGFFAAIGGRGIGDNNLVIFLTIIIFVFSIIRSLKGLIM
jgi:hypothetical protein